MSKITISKAIELSPVGRTQFYKEYINTGKITVSVDERNKKFIDTSELLRVFGSLTAEVHEQGKVNSPEQSSAADSEQSEVIKLLKEQLADLKADTRKREEHYQSQIIALTNRLEAPATNYRPNPFVRWWRGLDDKQTNDGEQ